MTKGPSKWTLLAVIFGVMVVGDQASKFLAVDRLTWAFPRVGATSLGARIEAFYTMKHLEGTTRPPHVVWGPMWRMTYAENPGAAWDSTATPFEETNLASGYLAPTQSGAESM